MAGRRDKARLGRPRKVFHGRKVGWHDLFLWILPGFFFPVCMLAAGFSNLFYGYAHTETAYATAAPWFAFAAIALVPFAALSLRRFLSARQMIVVHSNGLLFRHVRSAPPLLLWDEVRSVRTGGTRRHFFGRTTGEQFTIFIEPAQGQEIVLSGQPDPLQELAARIKRNIYPRLFPKMAAGLDAGNRVPLGPLVLDRRCLEAQGESIPWPQLRAIRVERGVMSIDAEGRRPIHIRAEDVPNQELALQLAARFSDSGRS